MNFTLFFLSLVTGFGVSFIVLDASRMVGRGHWPSAHGVIADNFRAFAVFLALFAGPALFVRSLWRLRTQDGRMSLKGLSAGVVIGSGWAFCYGLVVIRCVGLLELTLR